MSNDEWTKIEPEDMKPAWNTKDDDGNFTLKMGDAITGIYKGKEENVGPNNSVLYTINTKDGERAVWGSTIIDSRLKNIEEGMEVRIVYKGEEQSEKTKRTYRNYEVYKREPRFDDIPVVDDDDEIDVDEIDL